MIEIRAEMTANVWQVLVVVDQHVEAGEELVILESMKMEIPVEAPVAGRVAEVRVVPDESVRELQVLVVIDPD